MVIGQVTRNATFFLEFTFYLFVSSSVKFQLTMAVMHLDWIFSALQEFCWFLASNHHTRMFYLWASAPGMVWNFQSPPFTEWIPFDIKALTEHRTESSWEKISHFPVASLYSPLSNLLCYCYKAEHANKLRTSILFFFHVLKIQNLCLQLPKGFANWNCECRIFCPIIHK